MTGQQLTIDDAFSASYKAPCVERRLPVLGTTWIHSYTWADFSQIRRQVLTHMKAANEALDLQTAEPDPDLLRLYQMVWVCRTAPHSEDRSFVIQIGQEVQAMAKLRKLLPYVLVDMVCREADALALTGYVPAASAEEQQAKQSASDSFITTFGKPETFAHLNWLAQDLFGKPLADLDDQSIGEALASLERHQQDKDAFIEAVYALFNAMNAG